MEQTTTVETSKHESAEKSPGKKHTLHDHSKGNHQNNDHHLKELDKYFQVLPLVENFLNETDPQLKKSNGIFFTPYSVVSFIVRSKKTGQAGFSPPES